MAKQKKQHIGAVVIFGYPGSGKSTQAQMIAEKFGLYHFNTGRFLENLVYTPARAKEKDIQIARKAFEAGELMDADFTTKHIGKRTKELATMGERIVFSGSPRTVPEAFGSKRFKKGLVDILESLYGKNGVIYILLTITQDEALERNSVRKVCSVCQSPLIGTVRKKETSCPFCGGKLYTRKLDKPHIIRERFKEYDTKTIPVIEGLRARHIRVHEISAKEMPYRVFEHIVKLLS